MVSYQVSSCSVRCRSPYWGPLLFLLYIAELEQLILRHGLHIHQYADDSLVYMSVSVSEVRIAIHSLAVCVHDVNEWMRASRLWLNPTKTQVMAWLRPAAEACRHQRHPVVIDHRSRRQERAGPWSYPR